VAEQLLASQEGNASVELVVSWLVSYLIDSLQTSDISIDFYGQIIANLCDFTICDFSFTQQWHKSMG
jgi:hypothetical protein